MKKRIILISLLCAIAATSCASTDSGAGSSPVDVDVTADTAGNPADTADGGNTADSGVTAPGATPADATTAETTTDGGTITAVPEPVGGVTPGYDKISNGILVYERGGHLQALAPVWGYESSMADYAKTVDEYAEKLPGVNVYSMITPTGVEFLLPEAHKGFSGSQAAKEKIVEDNLTKAKAVNIFGVLKEQVDKGVKVYSRTDHHWQPVGGYYAAREFARATGVPFNSDNYKVVTIGGYMGSMYNYSKDENLKSDPETFTLYIPEPNPPTKYYDTAFANPRAGHLIVSPDASMFYCSFLGSDDLIAEVTGSAGNGKTLVIFKDSYGNALVPFLTASYDKIYVCDVRYFKPNAIQFCKDVGTTDLLFAFYPSTPAGSNGKYIGAILNQ